MVLVTILSAMVSAFFLVVLLYKFGRMNETSGRTKHQISGGLAEVDIIDLPGSGSRDKINQNDLSGLDQLKQKFPNFVLPDFLVHAEDLFDTIFAAFTTSDRDALKTMMTANLYQGFLAQIRKREEKNLRQEVIIKHTKTTLDQIQILVTKAKLFVSFDVSQMNAMLNSDGASIDNPNKIYRNVLHKWIFERKNNTSNWILAKTTCVEI
ncbi:MAG: 39S ribosomal protein L45 [Holosporales bacterium]|nr:39S ribosomal protein L45 [Holosporales bacterium]